MKRQANERPGEQRPEKRRFERFPAQHIVSLTRLAWGLPAEPIGDLGRTLDVGAGGARLETHRALAIGDQVSIEIAVGSQIIQADATVVHVHEAETEMVAAGLVFDRVPPDDRKKLSALGYAA